MADLLVPLHEFSSGRFAGVSRAAITRMPYRRDACTAVPLRPVRLPETVLVPRTFLLDSCSLAAGDSRNCAT
jgi:hypothetical protein